MRNPLQNMFESQLSKVSENLTKALAELEELEVEGISGGGAVTVRMTGSGNVLSVKISPAAVDPDDLELLEDLVVVAFRDALARATALKREKLMGATPLGALGLEMPDVF